MKTKRNADQPQNSPSQAYSEYRQTRETDLENKMAKWKEDFGMRKRSRLRTVASKWRPKSKELKRVFFIEPGYVSKQDGTVSSPRVHTKNSHSTLAHRYVQRCFMSLIPCMLAATLMKNSSSLAYVSRK